MLNSTPICFCTTPDNKCFPSVADSSGPYEVDFVLFFAATPIFEVCSFLRMYIRYLLLIRPRIVLLYGGCFACRISRIHRILRDQMIDFQMATKMCRCPFLPRNLLFLL